MKYVRFQQPDATIRLGVLQNEYIQLVEGDLFGDHRLTDERAEYSSARLLAPCLPGKVVGAGSNYHSFLRAMGRPTPERPRIFFKPNSSVVGHGDEILCPDPDHNVVFEGELGVVIGRRCREATMRNALEHVFGYTCLNDVTDHTMLQEDTIWSRGKGADTFCPLGPAIATDINPFDVMIKTTVDDEVRQHESTAGMVFDVPSLIVFISRDITLYPGDVIATGSPTGTGKLLPGQTVTVEITGIGALQNNVKLARGH